MKKAICILLILWSSNCYPQVNLNTDGSEFFTQIGQVIKPDFQTILSFQAQNGVNGNYVLSMQLGNQNNAAVHQVNELGNDRSNQVISLQAGNGNEFSAEQIGSGNLVMSVQSAYLSNLQSLEVLSQRGITNPDQWSMPNVGRNQLSFVQEGNENSLSSLQQGSYNSIQAHQQGDENSIIAKQFGGYNHLTVTQNGMNNSVAGYIQENQSGSVSSDNIIQNGDNLTLISHDASQYKANGNSFSQSGSNLTLEVNNGLLNSMGGVDIVQTGKEMKVIVDQTYFLTH
jgi:hypothetical protein